MGEPFCVDLVCGARGRRGVAAAILLLFAAVACSGDAAKTGGGSAAPPAFDLLIRGGTIVDGTGALRFAGDVAVSGDRIVAVERPGILDAAGAAELIDAEGLIVAPGFIDHHAHVQTSIARYPLAENFTRQGITTILASLHSGDQPWPFGEYLDSLEVALNVGFFAGHTWTRRRVLGNDNRAPTAGELDEMRRLVDQTMREGALGLSTGLLYVPANFAETEEVIALAEVAARHGGIYVTHMRDEATGLLDSVAESIRIGREAGIPVQIQHHKAVGETQWGWSELTLEMIDSARAEGLDLTLDQYPYTASSTSAAVLFPQWALAGGRDDFAARIADPAQRAAIEEQMYEIFTRQRGGNDIARVQFRTVSSMPAYNGRTLADLARDRGLPLTVASGIALVIELQLQGGFSAIYHAMSEEDVTRIMRHPYSMFDTDGDNVSYGIGHPHPRSYGTFPRILGRYVRERGVISLEEAIRKMTSLSADQIGQSQRGRIAEGMYADITVFDGDTIIDRATYTDPHQYSVGVLHVIVNGVPILRDAALTGEKPGRVLRGPARPQAVR
ncbi:MAG TPA: D-aminoacylase [Acidobacteriota bacterium]